MRIWIEVTLEITGTRGLDKSYQTMMTLKADAGERFVYDVDQLVDPQVVEVAPSDVQPFQF